MELLKKNMNLMREKERGTGQLTIEQDPNVPDSMPDVERIVDYHTDVRMEEIQVDNDKVKCSGYLLVQVMYIAENQEHSLQGLETKIPFEKSQNLPGVSAQDEVLVRWFTEDSTVRMINSRKLSVRTLLVFTYSVEEIKEIQTVVEVHGMEEISCQEKELELLRMIQKKKDIVRVKDEMMLPSNKTDIGRIIWKMMQLRNIETQMRDGQIEVKGDLGIFVLYEGDDENRNQEWLETTKHFQEQVECAQCRKDLVSEIDTHMDLYSLEAINDEDGEKRKISVEVTLGLDICLYEEEKIKILDDVYSPSRELIPVRETENYERLLSKNTFSLKVNDRVKISGSQPRMMQTCSCQGEVKVDEARIEENGIQIEGALLIRVLYVSSDDRIPYSVLQGTIPFQKFVEVPDMAKQCRYRVVTNLEQLSTTMADSEELEVKASIGMAVTLIEKKEEACIVDIQEKELDMKKLQAMPGMIGYIVQPGDSLWSIARQYYTTPEKICALNKIKEKDFHPGLGLIILKTVS